MASSTIFITGGSGFVGQKAIEHFRARGHRVRALARSDAAVGRVEAAGAEAVRDSVNM